ncbi:hypothetical protein [Actibacterium pelagium]|uniref:Lipoprotein n=1 Tax=Actibacterium pelagium TaxID=2029103 RepID=A0A917ABY2_9RHOB|nr:hypothetical protein [Actibacterium pelagium]GGE40752.1 hypothetical protein GCM10011517_05510 [Actibacterium pelagium]
MSKTKALLLIISAAGFLSACTTADTYPISGEQCTPEDPVQTLDAVDCQLPV